MRSSFREVFGGRHSGLLEWADYDAVMAAVAADPGGWYLYDTRALPPDDPLAAAALPAALTSITAFLKERHRADYCGFVYADDRAAPTMVKVYDPMNASSCSREAPLPVFILTRLKPEPLPFRDERPAPGLINRLFRGQN